MKSKQLTKRQKKAITPVNAAVQRSRRQGDAYEVAGTQYRGHPSVIDIASGVKTPGVPFVRHP